MTNAVASACWIPTISGREINLLDPTPEMIDPTDIAHGLARINRFVGQSRFAYNVAQHSYRVSEHCQERDERFAALLHDAHEAYLGDLSAPLKSALRHLGSDALTVLELRFDVAIAERFGLRGPDAFRTPAIVTADMRELATERRDVAPRSPTPWVRTENYEPFPHRIDPWPSDVAAERWLAKFQTFHEL